MTFKSTFSTYAHRWNISGIAGLLLATLLFANIFSGYINSWFLSFPVPTIGSVLRDLIFIAIIFPLAHFAIANKQFRVIYPVAVWTVAAVFCLALVFFSPSAFRGLMGFRNIFYPLAGISVLLFFHQSNGTSCQAIRLRHCAVTIFSVIAIIGILDFLSGGSFPELLGFNPAYNDLVSMMVRKHLGITRANAGVSDALNYGYLMAFTALYGAYLLDIEVGRGRRLLWLLVIASSVACVLSMTRGAIIALFLVMFLKMFMKAPFKTLFISVIFFAAIVSYALTTEYGQVVIDRFTERDPGSESSTNERINAALKSFAAIRENPLLGVGLGTQGAPTVFEDIDLRIATDNSFLWILLDTGVIGFLLIMSSYFTTFVFLVRKTWNRCYKKFVLLSLLLLIISAILSSAPVSPTFSLCFWIILTTEFVLSPYFTDKYFFRDRLS